MTETSSDTPLFDLPDPYATPADLVGYWQALTAGEQARAGELLKWAAQLINERPGSEDFDPATCAMVSLDMVKRAMINGDGVSDTTASQTMADMTGSVTTRYVNPVGNLYLTRGEVDRLARKSGPTAGSIALASNVRVPPEPWNRQPSGYSNASS